MKNTFIVNCFFVVVVFFRISAYAGTSTPVGIWKTVADEGVDKGKATSYVEIFENSGIYSGRIIRILVGSRNDVCKKCKGAKKGKKLEGLEILWGLKRQMDDNEFRGGYILDPGNGSIYKCTIKILDGGKSLDVRGYIGVPQFGRSQKWYRVR